MAVGATFPRGFAAAGVVAGIKASGRPDVALLVAEQPVAAAAVFTRSATAAAPVRLSRAHLEASGGSLRAVVVNAGNANAATGTQGYADAEAMAQQVATRIGGRKEEVLVCSTGVIGVPLPLDRVLAGIDRASANLAVAGGGAAAEAILTTDASSKTTEIEIATDDGPIRIGGMAKGAGMIRPDLGTMLAFVTTDADLDAATLDELLRDAVNASFNRITVDGTTSTSDTVVLMASGASGIQPVGDALGAVAEGLRAVCTALALAIVRDGEGAARIGRWEVVGAPDDDEALRLAFAVAEDQLVRCALNGGDPNWGRVVAAIGGAGGVDPDRITIELDGVALCRSGAAVDVTDPDAMRRAAVADEVRYRIDLGLGSGGAVVWGSDLSTAYVQLNAEYTT